MFWAIDRKKKDGFQSIFGFKDSDFQPVFHFFLFLLNQEKTHMPILSSQSEWKAAFWQEIKGKREREQFPLSCWAHVISLKISFQFPAVMAGMDIIWYWLSFPQMPHWVSHANTMPGCGVGGPCSFCGQASGKVATLRFCAWLTTIGLHKTTQMRGGVSGGRKGQREMLQLKKKKLDYANLVRLFSSGILPHLFWQ